MPSTAPEAAATVDASAVHGRGVYATRDLAAGEEATVAHALVLEADEIDAVSDHRLASYLVAWDEHRAAVPFGPLSFTNHDARPNAELVVDHDQVTVALVTRMPVARGDELTIDYGPDHTV